MLIKMIKQLLRNIWVHTIAVILVLSCVPVIILSFIIHPFKKD